MTEFLDQIETFLRSDVRKEAAAAAKAPTTIFTNIAQRTALEVFGMAAKTVPAYRDFLKKHKINPEKIKSVEDFKQIPLTSKKNYLSRYPLKSLLVSGNWSGKYAITSSSGSSGHPCYWPRFFVQDIGVFKGLDSMLVNLFDTDKKSTLHLNCAGMGVWTAGDMNGFANKFLALKYRNSSSISPGIDIDNALWTLEGIARDFDQVIIYGYPPFLKDLVDQMPKKVIRGTEIKLVAYGEPFSESWREYVAKKLGAKEIHRTVASLLGSSEGGLVGSEMAGAIVVRRAAKRSQELRRELFGSDLIPSLVQFSPMSKYMEVVNLQLVMTNKGGLPLIRYDTRDVGGLLDAETIDTQFKKVLNKSYFAELKRLKISHTNLPYVYLFGRSDYSATIYGITISPDQIKDVLVGSKALNSKLTSRFTLKTVYNERGDQYLELVCELRKNIGASGARSASLGRIIANKLTKVSTEYGKLLSSMGERVFPKVVTKRYGDTQYFSSKNKQKYLI